MSQEEQMPQAMVEYPPRPMGNRARSKSLFSVIPLFQTFLHNARQELLTSQNDLTVSFRLRRATACKLAFYRAMLRRLQYNPITRSTRAGPNSGVPVLIPWILTQIRRERSNLVINDENRRLLRSSIEDRRADVVTFLRQIEIEADLDKAWKLRYSGLIEEQKDAINDSFHPATKGDNANNAGPSNAQA
ncbi:uncharacterized protein LAJ45_03577 [Morchella importuna]|uniref:uncharacterized protein n=1 Tax=Morchella importuna TaxID=1174673 RepID=UPI001E8E2FFC|nr:uncharacterized protein LAJ45_03577 [Morchella importuna]KAH8152151.1 hypothetical protein LAJ45_03577 [Morchella importuna]